VSGLPLSALGLGWIVLSVLLGGLLRGFTGFGFAIAATPLLSLALPPVDAVVMVMLMGFGIGLTDLKSAVEKADRRAVVHLASGMVVATPAGVLALTMLPAAEARFAIALVLVVTSLILVSGLRFRSVPGAPVAVGLGALSGLFNGLAAMPGPPVIAYCLALPLSPDRIRATMMLYFLATSAIGLSSAALSGLLSLRGLLLAALAFPILLLGVRVGAAGFRRFGLRLYRPVSVASLAVLTAVVLVNALVGIG
jgi:uncharacterized membrane protein YfcA